MNRLGDAIEIEMVLPSGQPGLRLVGHAVMLRIDPEFAVEVVSPSSGRVLLRGAWNLCAVCWDLPENRFDHELCWTAIEMLDERVARVANLFRISWLDASWLTGRARYEVGAW